MRRLGRPPPPPRLLLSLMHLYSRNDAVVAAPAWRGAAHARRLANNDMMDLIKATSKPSDHQLLAAVAAAVAAKPVELAGCSASR